MNKSRENTTNSSLFFTVLNSYHYMPHHRNSWQDMFNKKTGLLDKTHLNESKIYVHLNLSNNNLSYIPTISSYATLSMRNIDLLFSSKNIGMGNGNR